MISGNVALWALGIVIVITIIVLLIVYYDSSQSAAPKSHGNGNGHAHSQAELLQQATGNMFDIRNKYMKEAQGKLFDLPVTFRGHAGVGGLAESSYGHHKRSYHLMPRLLLWMFGISFVMAGIGFLMAEIQKYAERQPAPFAQVFIPVQSQPTQMDANPMPQIQVQAPTTEPVILPTTVVVPTTTEQAIVQPQSVVQTTLGRYDPARKSEGTWMYCPIGQTLPNMYNSDWTVKSYSYECYILGNNWIRSTVIHDGIEYWQVTEPDGTIVMVPFDWAQKPVR